jgi:hypothetical protein
MQTPISSDAGYRATCMPYFFIFAISDLSNAFGAARKIARFDLKKFPTDESPLRSSRRRFVVCMPMLGT